MRGFSVAQLVIVLGILIIVSVVTFPVLSDYSNNLELKNATKEFVSNIKLAQQLAISEQIKHAISFTMMSGNYSLIKKTEPEENLSNYLLEDDVYFVDQSDLVDNEIVYNAGGAVDYSGEIYLSHLDTQLQTVVFIKPSGYVNWQIYEQP